MVATTLKRNICATNGLNVDNLVPWGKLKAEDNDLFALRFAFKNEICLWISGKKRFANDDNE